MEQEKNSKKYLLDTSFLVNYPSFLSTDNSFFIPYEVLEELDSIKIKNKSIEEKVGKTTAAILKNQEKITFLKELDWLKGEYVDDILLQRASIHGYCLLTNDIVLFLKGTAKGIDCQLLHPENDDMEYTGIIYLVSGKDDELISDVYLNNNEKLSALENQFVFIVSDGDCKEQFVVKNNSFIRLKREVFRSTTFTKEIKPKNPEQNALMNSLKDENNTIIFATGFFGTGKTFLLTSFALSELEKGNIDKIVLVPNNSINDSSREVGTLPGDIFEKEIAYLGMFVDMIGDIEEVRRLYSENKIEIMPISLARGRNLENCIIIVNEAQNLTFEHIKLLLGRCAQGTRIFFDGDVKQTDNDFKEKSGLKKLVKLKDSKEFSKIFSMVKLNSIERSVTAKAADYLDNL